MMTALNPIYFALLSDYFIKNDPIPLFCFYGKTLTGPNVIVGS